MKTIIFLLLSGIVLAVSAQVNPTTDSTKYSDPQNMDVVYTGEAHYDGTDADMYAAIYKAIAYTAEAKSANIDDEVLLSFDVNFDGKTQGFTIIKGVGYGIDEQIVKAVESLKFIPAVMNGIPVRQNVMLTIPIRTYPEM